MAVAMQLKKSTQKKLVHTRAPSVDRERRERETKESHTRQDTEW